MKMFTTKVINVLGVVGVAMILGWYVNIFGESPWKINNKNILGVSSPLKGVTVIDSCDNLKKLRVGWYYNYGISKNFECDGVEYVPMVRDKGQLYNLPQIAPGAVVLGFNEPNLHDQSNMTLEEVVDGIKKIVDSVPGVRLVSPALFDPRKVQSSFGYTYTHNDIVQRYREKYGCCPPYAAFAVHGYGYSASTILEIIDYVKAQKDAMGYENIPIWLTEYGAWPGGNSYSVATGVINGLKTRPWVERHGWFPGKPVTDPSAVDWTKNALMDNNGNLTSVGVYFSSL